MDVYVDTSTLTSGKASVRGLIGDLERYTSFMMKKISAAHDRFNSRNYDRILSALQNIKRAIEVINERLEDSRIFLDDLLECIEEYNRLKY